MQFNGHATNLDICSTADDMLSTDDVSFPIDRKTRFANQVTSEIWKEVWDSENGWSYQDANDTANPYGTVNLVTGTSEYAIPASAQAIVSVGVWDSSTSTYAPIAPWTSNELAETLGMTYTSFTQYQGTPTNYVLVGNKVHVFPASDADVTAGLAVFFDRASVYFATTDTTKTPGFAQDFHPLVAVGMAAKEAARARLPSNRDLNAQYAAGLVNVSDFYRKRFSSAQGPSLKRAKGDSFGGTIRMYM